MAYDGTAVGSPTLSNTAASYSSSNNAANFGNCLALNGSGQYVTIPKGAVGFSSGDTWTARFRMRTTTAAAMNMLSFGSSSTGASNFWTIYIEATGVVRFYQHATGGIGVTGGCADGNWHEIEVEVNAGGLSILRVDGTQSDAASNSLGGVTSDPNEKGCIGGRYNGSSTPEALFTGQLDEVSIWNGAPHGGSNYTPDTSPVSNSASNLRVLYHFDGDVIDSAGLTGGGAATVQPIISIKR